MRVRVAIIAMLVVAVAASTAMPTRAAARITIRGAARITIRGAARITIPVVRCPTSFGVTPGRIPGRRTLTLRGAPGSTARLTAYTNTSGYLIGPPHLRCAGVVGVDGNATIQAWPSGQPQPGPHSAGAGLALSVIPACVGCKAAATCHYFPTFRRSVRQLGLVCRPEPPPGERLRYLCKHLVAFVDPPFVKGAGWPSGAGLRATGLVGIVPGASQVVFTSSCTLPAAQRAVCVDSADAERSLFW